MSDVSTTLPQLFSPGQASAVRPGGGLSLAGRLLHQRLLSLQGRKSPFLPW